MPLIIALLKINITLALCYGLYYFLLRKLTFYNFNRIFFLSAIALSCVMPFIHIRLQAPATPPPAILEAARIYTLPVAAPAAFDYTGIVKLAFCAGAVLMLLRLIFQLVSVLRLYIRSHNVRLHDTSLRILPGHGNPFSFLRSIFLFQDRLADQELPMIIAHEKVHAGQWHSIDILACELYKALCWFNPAAWLMMRAVKQNLEFIADREVLKKGAESRAYQYSLLQVSQAAHNIALTNNFNFSNLKTRIIMMNKKQSSPLHVTRYFVAAPLALALVCYFGVSMAQQKKLSPKETPQKEQRSEKDAEFKVKDEAKEGKQAATNPGKIKSVRITKTANTVNPEGKRNNVAVVETESGEIQEIPIDDSKAKQWLSQKKEKPLVILDGEKISYDQMEKIDPETIKAVTVLKNSDAITRYGEEAKEGVVIIESKKD